jgi:membrane protease YdiL (CAAX protease family)
MSNIKKVVVKDFQKRKTVVGFLILPAVFLFATLFGLPAMFFGGTSIVPALIATLLGEFTAIVWALSYCGELKNWKSFLKFDKFSIKHVLYAALAGVGLFVLLQVLASLAQSLGFVFENSDTSNSIIELNGVTRFIVSLVVTPMIVPIIEETIYRAIILSSITEGSLKNKKFVKVLAVLTSVVFFASVHFQGLSSFSDIFVLLWTGFIALVSSIFYLKTRSIYPSIVLHGFYNGTIGIISIIMASS